MVATNCLGKWRVLVLVMLGLVVACDDSGGSSDVVGQDDVLAGDGGIQTDVPMPEGAIPIVAGDLDAGDAVWIAAGTAWSRAASAATQMVSAVNGFALLAVNQYGQSIRTERMAAALKSLETLEDAGQGLEQAADDLLAGALAAVAQAVSAPSGDAFALASRQASIAQELRDMGTACVAEAGRVAGVLDGVDAVAVTNDDLDEVVANLKEGAVLLVAAGPVLASAGTVTHDPLAQGAQGALAAGSAGNVGMMADTQVAVLSGWADPDGTAGPVPMAGDSPGVVFWRGDALALSPQDRAVVATPTQPDTLDGQLAMLSFPHPAAATVETRPLAAGEACWRDGAGGDPACTLAESGLLAAGYYVDRAGGGNAVQTAGISQAVGRRIATGLLSHEVVVPVPEDTEAPVPVIDSMSPEEGAVGTTVTLQGRNFGSDPGRVSVRFDCGRWARVAPNAVSDTSVSATFPATPWPEGSGAWCSFNQGKFLSCGVSAQVGAHTAWGGYLKLTGLPSCPPSPLYPPDPAIASVGDPIRVYGRGFSENPEANVVLFEGGKTAKGIEFQRDKYEPELALVTFVIPEGAQTGEVRFQNTAGVQEWSQPSTMTIVPPTVPIVGAGNEADGVHVPVHTKTLSDGETTLLWEPHSWILSHENVGSLRAGSGEQRAGHVLLDVQTRAGDFTLDAYAMDDRRLLVPRPFDSEGILGRLDVGDLLTVRMRAHETVNTFERIGPPLELRVASKMEPGVSHPIRSDFEEARSDEYRMRVAVGDVVILYPDEPEDVVATGGLTNGPVVFQDLAEEFAGWNYNAVIKGVRIPVDRAGTWTLTNTRTEATMVLEGVTEGVQANESWSDWYLAANGASLACGGARITIPPGALPDRDGDGSYLIWCERTSLETLGLAELTAGGLKTGFGITPEPPELLKPITVTIPFDPASRGSDAELGVLEEASGLYAALPATREGDMLKMVLPAGSYATSEEAVGGGASSQAVGPRLLPITDLPWPLPNLPLNRMLGAMAAVSYKHAKGVLRDDVRQIQVNYVATPGTASYVTDDYAGEVLVAAQAAWDTLTGKGWPKPDGWLGGWIKLTITDMGPSSGTKGSTTKGVFGQPWVKINSQLASGKQLATTTAHEMGHVFQRQVTTVFSLKWIDEAAAGWAAVASLGSDADLTADIIAGAEFPTVSLPGTFGSGYDVEQGYAAAVLAIWMEDVSSGSVLRVYEQLRDSTLAWLDAPGTLAAAMGMNAVQIVNDFGRAYWSQSLDVLAPLSISQGTAEWTTWEGASVGGTRPRMSSRRFDISTVAPGTPALAGRDVVVRASGLESGRSVVIYRDTVNCGAPAPAMQAMKTLFHDDPNELLGPHDSATRCYRVLTINTSDSAAVSVRIVTPQITSVSPSSGKNEGGYPVSIGGTGFGAEQGGGGVFLSGFQLDVTSWSDDEIRVTMLDAGTMVGDLDVKVLTDEQAWTNAGSFTLVD